MYRFTVWLSIILVICFLPGTVLAEGLNLCLEPSGNLYVNVSMKSISFGTGYDGIIPVEVREVRPRTQDEVDTFKEFNYYEGKDESGAAYADGRSYDWVKELNTYRLYKRIRGGKARPVRVFAVVLPRGREDLYKLRLRQANPILYSRYDLQNKFKVLGVMGISYRGRSGQVDFINTREITASASTFPEVMVSNADSVLYKYALAAAAEGVTNIIVPEDLKDPDAVKLVLERAGEARVLKELDTIKHEILGAAEQDPETLASTIGGVTVTAGLTNTNVQLVYLPCIPDGDKKFGGPKASFVPVRIKNPDDQEWKYPIFVYPTAFTSLKVLNDVIKREWLHARWWNVVGNVSADGGNEKVLREAFLRTNPASMEASIYDEMSGFSWGSDDAMAIIYNSHRTQLWGEISKRLTNPYETKYSLPWTSSIPFHYPEADDNEEQHQLHDFSDNVYNVAMRMAAPRITEFLTNAPTFDKVKEKKVIDTLVNAMAIGYTKSKAQRTAILRATLNDAAFTSSMVSLNNYGGVADFELMANSPSANQTDLIERVEAKGFGYSDLEWLLETTKTGRPLQNLGTTLYGKRLKYLVETKGVKAIAGLESALMTPAVVSSGVNTGGIKNELAGIERELQNTIASPTIKEKILTKEAEKGKLQFYLDCTLKEQEEMTFVVEDENNWKAAQAAARERSEVCRQQADKAAEIKKTEEQIKREVEKAKSRLDALLRKREDHLQALKSKLESYDLQLSSVKSSLRYWRPDSNRPHQWKEDLFNNLIKSDCINPAKDRATFISGTLARDPSEVDAIKAKLPDFHQEYRKVMFQVGTHKLKSTDTELYNKMKASVKSTEGSLLEYALAAEWMMDFKMDRFDELLLKDVRTLESVGKVNTKGGEPGQLLKTCTDKISEYISKRTDINKIIYTDTAKKAGLEAVVEHLNDQIETAKSDKNALLAITPEASKEAQDALTKLRSENSELEKRERQLMEELKARQAMVANTPDKTVSEIEEDKDAKSMKERKIKELEEKRDELKKALDEMNKTGDAGFFNTAEWLYITFYDYFVNDEQSTDDAAYANFERRLREVGAELQSGDGPGSSGSAAQGGGGK